MGASQSKKIQAQIFRMQDWQLIEWQPYTNTKDPTYSSNFQVYINKNNPNLQLEKYILYFNSHAQYVSYLQIFYQRKKCPYLVNSIHIEPVTKKNMCSTFLSANIFLQRIHFRLYQLIEIPIEEGLFIISSSLQGYGSMFNKTGFFEVSLDMIGVNKQGKVKVWFNKNFAKNYPQFNKIDQNKNESDFIWSLIKMIEQSIDYPKKMPKFSQFIQSKQLMLSFSNTKTLLKQYHITYKIFPQKQLKSIILWLKRNTPNNKINNKNILIQNQQLLQMKTSSFSSKSHQNKNYNSHLKSNQQSQKIIKNLYHHYGIKKIQFNKIKNKKNLLYPNKYNYQKTSSSALTLVTQNQNKNNLANKIKNQDGQRYTLPVYLTNTQPIHVPFVKYQGRLPQTSNFLKIPLKTPNKLPSVSFSYKNGGIFSPQHHELNKNEWFSNKTQYKQQPIKYNKTDPKQPIFKSPASQNQNLYCTNTDIYQIDPDIAKDLNLMQELGY